MPAWAVSRCDGGHAAVAGCAQLLLPFAAECLQLFGALLQGIPELFERAWLAVWQIDLVQAVQFWPLLDNYISKTGTGLITVQNVYSPACESYPECPVAFVRNELFLDVGVCILRLGDSLGICRELGVAIFTKAKHRNICSLVGRS
jgi:hypothetical protein